MKKNYFKNNNNNTLLYIQKIAYNTYFKEIFMFKKVHFSLSMTYFNWNLHITICLEIFCTKQTVAVGSFKVKIHQI